MSTSEFRYNKKRKHYAYLFKTIGSRRVNILISSKPIMVRSKNKKKIKLLYNVPLFRHPSLKKKGCFYLIPICYCDDFNCFGEIVYLDWFFDINDKRNVKRIKKGRTTKKSATIPVKANHRLPK